MSKPEAPVTHPSTAPSKVPRAVIHKKILDAAQAKPKASMKTIAGDVSGASVDLVERVFEEYGDPVSNGSPVTTSTAAPPAVPTESPPETDPEPVPEEPDPPSDTELDVDVEAPPEQEMAPDAEPSPEPVAASDSEVTPDPEPTPPSVLTELTEKQRETLEAIYEHPTATQAELGDRLSVSDATICQRVNSIDGFEWTAREEFVTTMYQNGKMESDTTEEVDDTERKPAPEHIERIAELADQIEALERRIDAANHASTDGFGDPELVHKIVHACLQSEQISEEEELEILKSLLGNPASK